MASIKCIPAELCTIVVAIRSPHPPYHYRLLACLHSDLRGEGLGLEQATHPLPGYEYVYVGPSHHCRPTGNTGQVGLHTGASSGETTGLWGQR